MTPGFQKIQELLKDPEYKAQFYAKQKASLKKAKHMQGNKNSQFGTCWIHDNFQNLKIKKEDLHLWIVEGWVPGRKMNFNTEGKN